MSKAIKIFILLIVVALVFNKQLITYYYSYKFSNWIERQFVVDKIYIDYPNSIVVSGIKIKNLNPFYYEYILESEKIALNFDLKSLLFSNLIIINNLIVENPKFFLEIVEINKNSSKNEDSSITPITYDDNIGLAKKITENTPDKIWPDKKKDINFLILKTKISGAKAFIKISSLTTPTKIKLSDMYFNNIGNEKNYQHYKEVFRLILFDTIASTTDFELKKLLKKIYNY
tara:strand:- start:39 stop:728 length:690 start_codon:yes stop_codon:yes gene_type:complete